LARPAESPRGRNYGLEGKMKKTRNEITISTMRHDFRERDRTVRRRLESLLYSGRIKRVVIGEIDFGLIKLYTYWRCL